LKNKTEILLEDRKKQLLHPIFSMTNMLSWCNNSTKSNFIRKQEESNFIRK